MMICSRGRRAGRCSIPGCDQETARMCDWPAGRRTCSARLCARHAVKFGAGDLCPNHEAMRARLDRAGNRDRTDVLDRIRELADEGAQIAADWDHVRPRLGQIHLVTARCKSIEHVRAISTARLAADLSRVTCRRCLATFAWRRAGKYLRPDVRTSALVFLDWIAEAGLTKNAPPDVRRHVDDLNELGVDYRRMLKDERTRRGPLVIVDAEMCFGDERMVVMQTEKTLGRFSGETQRAVAAGDIDAQIAVFGREILPRPRKLIPGLDQLAGRDADAEAAEAEAERERQAGGNP